MGVRVDEARKNGIAAEIDFFRTPGSEREHFVVGADCRKSPVRDRNRLGAGLARVHRPHVGIVQNKVGFAALDREQRQGAEAGDKLTAGSGHEIGLRWRAWRHRMDARPEGRGAPLYYERSETRPDGVKERNVSNSPVVEVEGKRLKPVEPGQGAVPGHGIHQGPGDRLLRAHCAGAAAASRGTAGHHEALSRRSRWRVLLREECSQASAGLGEDRARLEPAQPAAH